MNRNRDLATRVYGSIYGYLILISADLQKQQEAIMEYYSPNATFNDPLVIILIG